MVDQGYMAENPIVPVVQKGSASALSQGQIHCETILQKSDSENFIYCFLVEMHIILVLHI